FSEGLFDGGLNNGLVERGRFDARVGSTFGSVSPLFGRVIGNLLRQFDTGLGRLGDALLHVRRGGRFVSLDRRFDRWRGCRDRGRGGLLRIRLGRVDRRG